MLNKSAFALALAVVLVGCGSHPDAPTAKAETSAPKLVAVGKEKAIAMDEQSIKLAGITVAKASADDLATSTQPTGEISPTDSGTIQVTSRLPGKITEARVSTGDIVKKGQVITAKCLGVDEKGRVKMSRRAWLREQKATEAEAAGITE